MWRRSESGWVLELDAGFPLELAWFAHPGGSWVVVRLPKEGRKLRVLKAAAA